MLTEEEARKWEALAKRARRPLSVWIRENCDYWINWDGAATG